MSEQHSMKYGKQAFTRKEAGQILGVSEGLVIKLDAAGKIKTIRIGRRKLVPREEIERVLGEGV
jgi:excisionase family DNA binding protein